jgi:hypothetical protein
MMLGELMAAALIRSEVSWQAITTVAQALMDRGELSGDEVDALCATVYGHERPSQKAWQDSWPSDPKVIRAGWIP